jgi:exoribonuclease R
MSNNILVGVLELSCGKTYGRQVKSNGKIGKLYYGISHSYKDIPSVKTPYEIKKTSCSRYYTDKYVLFEIVKHSNTERPEAILVETLGNTDNLEAFCKYRAYQEDFSLSSSWNKEINNAKINELQKCQVKDNINININNIINLFTIDPKGCCDMDDALGIRKYINPETKDEMFDIYVAITCVPSYLVDLIDLGLSPNELINSLKNTCSLYLCGNIVNMMPKRFAENICSLNKDHVKQVLVLKIFWNNTQKIVEDESLSIENAKIVENYVYDSIELLRNESYQQMFDCVKDMISNCKTFDTCSIVNDSHTMVEYLMTYMNKYVSNFLDSRNLPCIYRVNMRKSGKKELPEKMKELERKIGYYSGNYCTKENIDLQKNAENNDILVWTHITSPMRRLTDLTNMITVVLNIEERKQCTVNKYLCLTQFRDYCLSIVEKINYEYKKSRRVSLDCELFNFIKQSSDKILTKEYEGLILDIENTNEYEQILVTYIEELSRIFNIKNKIVDNKTKFSEYDKINCRIIVFDECQTINDKVRLIKC